MVELLGLNPSSCGGGCCVSLAVGSLLDVLMRCCLLDGVTGESRSAISRTLGAALAAEEARFAFESTSAFMSALELRSVLI